MLPAPVLRKLAAYRFGYTQQGRHFAFAREDGPDGPSVVVGRGLRMRVTPAFLPDVEFHFVENGQSRDEMGAFIDIQRILPPDAMLLDVGAHRGLFSLVHCASGEARRAVLFEPSASLAADARTLLRLNGFDRRTDVCVSGVGDRREPRPIVEDALGFARAAPRGSGTATVDFTTLDHEWRRLGAAPAIVKIDVEGAEAEVVRGAEALLRETRPIVFLELHLDELERRQESIEDLLRPLTAQGYQYFDPSGRSLSIRSIAGSLRAILRLVATTGPFPARPP
ncbi:MAG: FkbM family methyltransferase [Acidobacteria bacterium]|nr:FkbM family methyltransferase [Acidobacteriota bacterium]